MNTKKLTEKELERLTMQDLYKDLKDKGTPLMSCGGIYYPYYSCKIQQPFLIKNDKRIKNFIKRYLISGIRRSARKIQIIRTQRMD